MSLIEGRYSSLETAVRLALEACFGLGVYVKHSVFVVGVNAAVSLSSLAGPPLTSIGLKLTLILENVSVLRPATLDERSCVSECWFTKQDTN